MRKIEAVLSAVGVIIIILIANSLSALATRDIQTSNHVYRVRVACIGDSITDSSGYPYSLQFLLGDNCTVSNFGVSGASVLRYEKPYLEMITFEAAKKYLPDIVVIMLGTNDANCVMFSRIEEFKADYKELVNSFLNLSSRPKVYLVTPPPIFIDGMNLLNQSLSDYVIPCITEVSEELNLPLIDINSLIGNQSKNFPDGIHPNRIAASLMAIEISKAITSD